MIVLPILKITIDLLLMRPFSQISTPVQGQQDTQAAEDIS